MNRKFANWRHWALPGFAAACLALSAGASYAATAEELEMKSLGTTDNINPVVAEAFKRFAVGLTPEQRELALKCWKDSVCETGHGDLTVASPTASARTSGARSPRWSSSSRR